MSAQSAAPELKVLIGAALENAINKLISLDEQTGQRLSEIDNRFISLEITDLDITLVFHIQAPKIRLMTEFFEADTLITTNSKTITEMGLQKVTGDSPSLHGKLEITGNIEVGQSFKSILDSLNIDWEEHLSHIAGDVFAHQFFRAANKFSEWGKETWQHFTQDSSAWLTDEQQLSPHKQEIENFTKQVNKTRNDVERIAARIQRLQHYLEQD